MSDPILQTIDGPIATVVLDNPDRMNALTLEAWAGLGRVMNELSENTDLRCVLIRGAGGKAFCAGADIADFTANRADAAEARDYGAVVADTLKALAGCLHPTVAVIEGACTGGGLEIACCCDIRIANESSRFGVPINRLGHAFAYPEMAPVVAAVGRGIVLELLLEGRIIDADEAERRGLVNRVVADADLDAEAEATARRIAEGAPLANRATKKFLNRLLDPTPLSQAELDEAYELCDSRTTPRACAPFWRRRNRTSRGDSSRLLPRPRIRVLIGTTKRENPSHREEKQP